MRLGVRALVSVATAAAVIAVPSVAVAAPVDGDAGPDRSGLQQRLDGVVTAGSVGALAEVRDGHSVWRGTSGTAELGKNRPVPVRGSFRAGSITKTFLATVVLQLVDEGSLRLDDSVERWLPGVVPNGENITVRQLLNHTSGLYDILPTLTLPPSPAFLDNRMRTWTSTELIQRALAHPPVFDKPGSAFSYSNTGYLLLGQIVEKVTHRSYGKEIERRVLRPLQLDHTVVPGTSPWIPGPHPHGYVPIKQDDGAPKLVDFTVWNPSVFGAAGEMISTTSDLNRFVKALLGGRLLPANLLAEMKTQGVPTGRPYGLGLAWRDTSCGLRVYGNDGDALTHQSWSFSTLDGDHQATISLTPTFQGDVDEAVDAFLDKAICG